MVGDTRIVWRRVAAALLLLGISFTGAAADLIVIGSTGADLKPGQVLDGSALVTLPAGATVTLISSKGETIKLRGPYEGRPASATEGQDGQLLQALQTVFKNDSGATTMLAAFRGVPGRKPDLWSANVDRNGSYCVRVDGPPALKRKSGKRRTTLMLELGATGEQAQVDWPAGQSTLGWPAGLPLIDGGDYLAHLDVAIEPKKLRVALIPNGLATDAHRAAWMAENGCSRQARRVLTELAR